MALLPIWKDYYQNLSPAASSPAYIDFKIQLTDTSEIIYTGRAFRINNGTLVIRINDIIADWLANVLPYGSYANITHPVKFDVYAYINNGWVKKNATPLQFINDWSYDSNHDVSPDGLCFPINGRIQSNQPLPYTGYQGTTVTFLCEEHPTAPSTITKNLEVDDDIPISDNTSNFYRDLACAGVGTALFFVGYAGLTMYAPEDIEFNVLPLNESCAKYALYYVNAYGGWDTFLIEGNVQEEDAISRYTKEQSYDNSSSENRWKANFANELTKTFTFHTGWLTDDESSRMHHLLESTNVYLYEFSTQTFRPLVITNSKCQHKTFKSNGRQMVDYEITADLAMYRVRR